MSRKDQRSQTGVALLMAVIVVMITLGLSGSMIVVSISNAKAVVESERRSRAFSCAESGLGSAKWELGEDQDRLKDGLGNHQGSLAGGTYAVSAVDLGDDFFRLTSTGSSLGMDVTIEEVVQKRNTTRFPGSAVSMVGGMATSQMEFSQTSDVTIIGDDTPGILLSDPDLYSSVTGQFAEAVQKGYLDEEDVSGSVTNTFQPGNAELSMAQAPQDEASLTIYASMYDEFTGHLNTNYLPGAAPQSLPGSGSVTYGSSASPANFKFPANQKLKSGQTLSGNGTLVFSRNLVVENGATLNWNGNLVIYADPGQDANLEVDGKLNVTGNILLVGSDGKNVKMLVKHQGEVTVNGALTALTEYSDTATKIEFYVENKLTVNGLITTVASKFQSEFKAGSEVDITGSFQIGRPHEAEKDTELKLKFEDTIRVRKDEQAIMTGADALVALGGDLKIPVIGDSLTRTELTTVAWRVLPEGP